MNDNTSTLDYLHGSRPDDFQYLRRLRLTRAIFIKMSSVVIVIVIQKTLIEHAEKLHQVKAVLEEGRNFSGIYMKVQLKPLKWDGEGEE
ncbi:hypothetical protein YC2023_081728 [Brassica napus]